LEGRGWNLEEKNNGAGTVEELAQAGVGRHGVEDLGSGGMAIQVAIHHFNILVKSGCVWTFEKTGGREAGMERFKEKTQRLRQQEAQEDERAKIRRRGKAHTLQKRKPRPALTFRH